MQKCVECGHIFEDGEWDEWREDIGEYWGAPCSELRYGCPKCHGYFEEATECKGCGEWFFTDELDDGLCEDCQEETED